MLFQATVPSTYAAGVASRAVWRPRATPMPPTTPIDINATLLCECGQRRPKTAAACTTCVSLDAAQDAAALDRMVINAFAVGEELSLMTVVERFAFKYERHVLYRSLRRLVTAERIARRHATPRTEGYLYTRRN